MSDLSIYQKFNTPIITPKSSNTNPIKPDTTNSGLSTGVKVAIGTGLTALAAYGIYAATRGKVKPKTAPIAETNNPVQEIKELTVENFKKVGHFNKGKAKLADGASYTGKIVSENKDGSKVEMEYLDGVLQKSIKTKGTETIFEKNYKYSDELGLKEVIENNETVLEKKIDKVGNLYISHTPYRKRGVFTKFFKTPGLVEKHGRFFIDKQKNIEGRMSDFGLICPKDGNTNVSQLKINNTQIPSLAIDPMHINQSTTVKEGEQILNWIYKGTKYNDFDTNIIRINNQYKFNSSGKYHKEVDLYGCYNKYQNLHYDYKSGIVTNAETPLFKFNYRTNEITDLKIDRKEAEELVNFAKEHYKHCRNIQKEKLKLYRAGYDR